MLWRITQRRTGLTEEKTSGRVESLALRARTERGDARTETPHGLLDPEQDRASGCELHTDEDPERTQARERPTKPHRDAEDDGTQRIPQHPAAPLAIIDPE